MSTMTIARMTVTAMTVAGSGMAVTAMAMPSVLMSLISVASGSMTRMAVAILLSDGLLPRSKGESDHCG